MVVTADKSTFLAQTDAEFVQVLTMVGSMLPPMIEYDGGNPDDSRASIEIIDEGAPPSRHGHALKHLAKSLLF